MNSRISYKIKNIYGEYKPMDIFQFFDNGIRKRLPKGIAKEFYDEVIHNIDNNTFGFTLSKRWQDYKRSIGADDRPYVMFGHYKNAISIITSNGHLSVGFKKTTMHPRAKISMGRLAVRLEYGDIESGIPARPLWRKTSERFFRERKRQIGEILKKSLK